MFSSLCAIQTSCCGVIWRLPWDVDGARQAKLGGIVGSVLSYLVLGSGNCKTVRRGEMLGKRCRKRGKGDAMRDEEVSPGCAGMIYVNINGGERWDHMDVCSREREREWGGIRLRG